MQPRRAKTNSGEVVLKPQETILSSGVPLIWISGYRNLDKQAKLASTVVKKNKLYSPTVLQRLAPLLT